MTGSSAARPHLLTAPQAKVRDWPAFVLWALSGAIVALAGFSPLSWGLVIVPAGMLVGLAALLLTRGNGLWGLLAGPAAMMFALAWLNRRGPGFDCQREDYQCVMDANPWPWLAAGLLVVALSAVLHRWSTRRVVPA